MSVVRKLCIRKHVFSHKCIILERLALTFIKGCCKCNIQTERRVQHFLPMRVVAL